jgi:hypothetical protein
MKAVSRSETTADELMIRRITPPQVETDEELLRRMLAGDGEAFEKLYDRRQAAFIASPCG